MKNLTTTSKLIAAAFAAVLVTGCASNDRIDQLEASVQKAQGTADEAKSAAANAQATADSALAAASDAKATAQSAKESADAANEKVDRMFKKTMMK